MARVVNQRNKQVVVEQLEEARSMYSRLKGLLGRDHLDSGRGLWIMRSGNSIHTFFMKFSIDILFIDKRGQVRHLVENIKPWRLIIAPLLVPTDCLELPAGTVSKTETRIGDQLHVDV